MSFFGPALLVGLLAAAIPPILHLLHRRKIKVVRFPALEFIQRANRKTARRFRMKQILLMAVRSLLLAALAFALARPYVRHVEAAVSSGVGGDGTTVFVVDASWPMSYRIDGDETLLDQARLQAGHILDQVRGRAAVVVAGARVDVPIGEVTGDLASVRRVLTETKHGARTGTLGEAVARGYELLVDVPGKRRVVVLTTPAGAASQLPPPPPASDGESGVQLIPVDVAEGRPLPNRAVLDVALRPSPELGAGSWRVDARVGNFADAEVKRLPLHLEVDGEVRVRGFIDLAAGGQGTKTFHVRTKDGEATPAAVVLEGDALATDDRRDFWLQPAPKLRVLAVNGDPRPVPQADELFYFERALSPKTTAGARVQLTVVGADTLDQHALSTHDVVVLANVGAISEDKARELEGFVRGGGGLLVTMGAGAGDRERRRTLNERLVTVLPRTLRDVRTAGDAAASVEGGDRRFAHPSVFERGHAVLQAFPDPAKTTLVQARIRRYMLLDPAPDAGGEVVIALDDGAPLLVTKVVDRGRVALLTATIDREWGDLPIRPDFLPLLQQTLRYLTRVADVDTTPVLVGRPAPVPVEDPRVRRVQIQTPGGELHTVERPRDEKAEWAFDGTVLPGHYSVTPDPPLPGLVALPGFAVAVDTSASDLRGPEVADADVAEGAAAELKAVRRTELWHAALFGLFALLLAEAVLLFRRKDELGVEDLA